MKIMFIRHAEKPEGPVHGVTLDGVEDKDDLTPLGWQRAGALARFFYPLAPNTIAAGLDVPTKIFAAAVDSESASIRPQHTVTPLAELMGLQLDIGFGDAQFDGFAAAAKAAAANGPVLVGWQHQKIPDLIVAVAGPGLSPAKWPGKRFDLVWVLDSADGTSWTFSQVPQLLLAGDSAKPARK